MESEFLLVWAPTAWLYLAAPGVTLSFVNSKIQGTAGDRDMLQWLHRTKLGQRAQGWGLCPDSATPICVACESFLSSQPSFQH